MEQPGSQPIDQPVTTQRQAATLNRWPVDDQVSARENQRASSQPLKQSRAGVVDVAAVSRRNIEWPERNLINVQLTQSG